MKIKDYIGKDWVKCWCCDHTMKKNKLMNLDGFCEECDAEIDLEEVPYIEKEQS